MSAVVIMSIRTSNDTNIFRTLFKQHPQSIYIIQVSGKSPLQRRGKNCSKARASHGAWAVYSWHEKCNYGLMKKYSSYKKCVEREGYIPLNTNSLRRLLLFPFNSIKICCFKLGIYFIFSKFINSPVY